MKEIVMYPSGRFLGWLQSCLDLIADVVSFGSISRARKVYVDVWREAGRLHDALEKIADCETSGANATVRRMVKIANDAMEGK